MEQQSVYAQQTDARGNSRRSELEVKMDILRVTGEGHSKPTQIMYKANLSWVALLAHLKALTTLGLLKEVDFANRRIYEVTPRGLDLLRRYQEVVSTIRDAPVERVSF